MKQRRFVSIFIVGIFVILLGIGGYLVFNRKTPPAPSNSPTPQSYPQPTASTNPKVDPQNPKSVPKAHNAFGFNMIRQLKQEDGNKNIFISPSSISIALSMVFNGAGGETKNAIQKTLELSNLDITTVNKENLNLINISKNPDPKVELSIANSVWAKQGMLFKQDFLDLVKNYYQAKTETLDFASPAAVNTINAWVSQNTKGKIPTIVKSIPNDIVMFLINAVYFKGSWTKEFDKKLTEDRNFTPSSGISKKYPLMKQDDKLPYLETDNFQSVSLTYGENKRLSMHVFLPKNLDSFISSLNLDNWNKWMPKYYETKGTILLPRFKMEYEKELKNLLTKLGMGTAFQDNADFRGIGDGLKISAVKHKTYVDVNEEGTEAAAVTSINVGITSIGIGEKPFYMEVNKPFFFVIRDNQTEEILFMGIIQNPD